MEVSDHSDDEYIDSVETPEPKKTTANGIINKEHAVNGAVQKEHISRAKTKQNNQSNSLIPNNEEVTNSQMVGSSRVDSNEMPSRNHIASNCQVPTSTQVTYTSTDISQEVLKAVQNLKVDLERLNNKISHLEMNLKSAKKHLQTRTTVQILGISPTLLAFIIAWPFITNFIIRRYLIRK